MNKRYELQAEAYEEDKFVTIATSEELSLRDLFKLLFKMRKDNRIENIKQHVCIVRIVGDKEEELPV